MLSTSRIRLTLTGMVLILLSAVLAVDGIDLTGAGWASWCVSNGVGMAITGLLLMSGQRCALAVFALSLLATLCWSVQTAQMESRSMLPQLAIWVIAGCSILSPPVCRSLGLGRNGTGSMDYCRAALIALVAASVLIETVELWLDYQDLQGEAAGLPHVADHTTLLAAGDTLVPNWSNGRRPAVTPGERR